MAVHLLRNPRSGRGAQPNSISESRLGSELAGHEVVDLTGDSAPDSSLALREAVARGEVERLVVAGGDGLVHLAIQEVAATGVPVAIIPEGTGNDFALALSEVSRPVRMGEPRLVDLLRVTTSDSPEPRWVATIVIAGFPAAINARANDISLPIGRSVYTVAALAELPRFSRTQITYAIDHGESTLERTSDSAMLAIGNTSFFGGGMRACPDAHVDDGLLHFTSIEGVGRIGILRHIQGQRGGTADRDEVIRHVGTKVEIFSAGIEFWGDGERIGQSPATIEIDPGALTLAP